MAPQAQAKITERQMKESIEQERHVERRCEWFLRFSLLMCCLSQKKQFNNYSIYINIFIYYIYTSLNGQAASGKQCHPGTLITVCFLLALRNLKHLDKKLRARIMTLNHLET
jgi:hypothetical protein